MFDGVSSSRRHVLSRLFHQLSVTEYWKVSDLLGVARGPEERMIQRSVHISALEDRTFQGNSITLDGFDGSIRNNSLPSFRYGRHADLLPLDWHLSKMVSDTTAMVGQI